MSIKHGLLALLSEGDAYGYQLRSRFETATGSVWALNIGQVYTTLGRLERDGLVEGFGADDAGRATYRITDAGRAELSAWWDTPITRTDRPRDELAIKVALAVTTPGVDARAVLQTQRRESIRYLQDLTRTKRTTTADDLAWRLILDAMIFAGEAEVRWLDNCETALVRGALGASRAGVTPSGAATTDTAADSGAADLDGVRK